MHTITRAQHSAAQVHVVNGLSKLGLAGFKIGALYTCNSSILQACQALAAGAPISTDTQYALASMLRDETFTSKAATPYLTC